MKNNTTQDETKMIKLGELEVTEEDMLLFDMWEAWQEKVVLDAQAQEELEKDRTVFIEYCKTKGLAVTETSPITLMFLAFLGGIESGMDLYEALDSEEEE